MESGNLWFKKKHQKIKQNKKITEHFRNTEVYNIF